jgi:hypothetical protein
MQQRCVKELGTRGAAHMWKRTRSTSNLEKPMSDKACTHRAQEWQGIMSLHHVMMTPMELSTDCRISASTSTWDATA